jgi:hypothetical protein
MHLGKVQKCVFFDKYAIRQDIMSTCCCVVYVHKGKQQWRQLPPSHCRAADDVVATANTLWHVTNHPLCQLLHSGKWDTQHMAVTRAVYHSPLHCSWL